MKRIAGVATRTASPCRSCRPCGSTSALHPGRRRFSAAFIFHTPKNKSDDDEASSANNDDTSNNKNPFANARLGGWDGSHLPKAMPTGWKERMAPFLPPIQEQEDKDETEDGEGRREDEFDFDATDLSEPLQQLRKDLDRYDVEVRRRSSVDPKFREYIKATADYEGGDEPPVDPNEFFAEEEEPEDMTEDEEWANDDITSQAHAELEQHRELRELARVTIWDMPLLWNHRKQFKAPTTEQVLRFRYTTYLGEHHPAARKVVVDFTPSALPGLTAVQVTKLIKLLGVRYNPSKDRAKMSCEKFATPAQNKRFLGDLLDKLVTEAKDPTDTLEDIPFDFRHHTPRPKLEFPPEWKITPERREMLDQLRKSKDDAEIKAAEQGRIVQGAMLVEAKTIEAPLRQRQPEPVMIGARQKRR